MQLSLQHEHTNKLTPSISLKSEDPKSSKNINKISQICSNEPAQSAFFVPSAIQPSTLTYNFYIDGLEEILEQSGKELGQNVSEAIKDRKKFSQQRIYQAIVNTSYDFVGVHLKQMKQGLKMEIHNLFENIHNSVEAGIWDGQYEINKRNNYYSTNRKEEQLVSYITQELVKRNIDSLRQELDSVEASQMFSASELHPKQQLKNKQAEEFVRKIQSQQARHKENMQKLREERLSLQIRSMQQKKVKEQEKKREHHSAIRHRIEKYNEMKTIQNEYKKKIRGQYMRFISSARKPLFKEIQERFEKHLAEEQKQKFKIMRKLMNERKPISFQEINQHMQKYEELLYQNEQFRQQKRELKENEMEIIASQRPYRSKFYSLVVDTSRRNSQIDNKTAILQRQMNFADYVRKNFVPKIDEAKQEQIEGLIRRITSQKKHSSQNRKHMQEGKKNLEKLHILIGELRAKNQIKESQPILESVEVPRKYVNYLEEVKKSRIQKSGAEISIDYDKKLVTKHPQELKIQAMIRQSKAKKKDHYLNSSVETMDFDTHMKGRCSVENDYLQAARAKMALLKRYKGEVESVAHKDQTLQ